MELNRRTFIEAAGAAAMAGVAAPAVAAPAVAQAEEAAIEPVETIDCDVVIVGAGLSGLCACVEAGHQGLNTVCVEGMSVTGGGAGMGVEGSFGIESSLTKAMDLHVDPREVYAVEMKNSQWRADGACWMDFMYQSGTNIDWLIEQGVMFEPTVDDYHGKDFNTFHWYKDGSCGVGFVPPMTAKAEELGVQFLFETLGKKLIQDESGKVCGLYAQRKEDGSYVQINAKAVILASGGFGSNKELVSQIGYPIDQLDCMFEFATGDGYLMATEVGAHSMMGVTADQSGSYFPGYMKGMDNIMWAVAPQLLWVNEDAARFFPEDNSIVCLSNSNAPKLAQKAHYALWDAAMMKDYTERNCITGNYIGDIIDDAIAQGGQGLYRADSVEELAGCVGLDPDKLRATVDTYNDMCAAGDDTEFGKDPQWMLPFSEPPYYLAVPGWIVYVICGAIGTNRNCQAVTDAKDPIPGLYAIGVDGVMLYRNVYTIGTPGSCSGWCIYSGRKAVQHAVETYTNA